MMRALRWLFALVAVFLVASLAAGAVLVFVEGEADVQADAPGKVTPWPRCRNAALGYSIAHPPGWHHDRNCAFFDPKPFTVPANSDFYGTALEVQVAQESWENVVRGLTNARFARVISRRELRVGGRRAVLVEVEATGEGLYERGYRQYGYVVDVPGRPPVIVQATRRPGAQWAGRRAVADRAARSLRLTNAAAANLPARVAKKRSAILAAARAHDDDALALLVDRRQFTYTYGGPDPGGPVAHWRKVARISGRDPIEILAAVLELPYTREQDVYVWPSAYNRPPDLLTAAERVQLSRIATEREIELWEQAGSYYGWRAGITADGRWIFFVAGD